MKRSSEKIVVVTRTFQAGKTFETFDIQKFERGVVAPIKKLLSTAPQSLSNIVVVACGEPGSEYAEEIRNNETPSIVHLKQAFPEEVASHRIITSLCSQWGRNRGSATALNAGVEIADELSATHALTWSAEIDLDGFMLSGMLSHYNRFNLDLVGCLRNRWYQRLQWMFAQNTCALWNMKTLTSIGGFNPDCNGDRKSTVKTAEFGDVPLAGMEDFEAYLRASKASGSFLRWGITETAHPAIWNLALKKPEAEDYADHVKKIARQELVMAEYAKRVFPDLQPVEVFDHIMEKVYIS